MSGRTSWICQPNSRAAETEQELHKALVVVPRYARCSVEKGGETLSIDESHGVQTVSLVSACDNEQEKLPKAGIYRRISQTKDAKRRVGRDFQTDSEPKETQERLWRSDHDAEEAGLRFLRRISSIHTDYKDHSSIYEKETIDTPFYVSVEESQRKIWETVHATEEAGMISSCPWSSIRTDYVDENKNVDVDFHVNAGVENGKDLRGLTVNCQAKAIQQKLEDETGDQPKSVEKETQEMFRDIAASAEEFGSRRNSLVGNYTDRSSINEEDYIEAAIHVNAYEEAGHKLRSTPDNRENTHATVNHSAENVRLSFLSGSSYVDEKHNIEAGCNSHLGAARLCKVEFLEACHLCKRQLTKDLDIFMYRGDQAFCSVQCRQKKIFMDQKFSRSRWKVSSSRAGGVRHSL